jgi:hypothetical protein
MSPHELRQTFQYLKVAVGCSLLPGNNFAPPEMAERRKWPLQSWLISKVAQRACKDKFSGKMAPDETHIAFLFHTCISTQG